MQNIAKGGGGAFLKQLLEKPLLAEAVATLAILFTA